MYQIDIILPKNQKEENNMVEKIKNEEQVSIGRVPEQVSDLIFYRKDNKTLRLLLVSLDSASAKKVEEAEVKQN